MRLSDGATTSAFATEASEFVLTQIANRSQLILGLNWEYNVAYRQMKENRISQGLLCFGGSFNPIHYGHLRCSQIVAQKLELEPVLLIPTAQAPHKLGHNDVASPADRLTMCRIAAEGEREFQVSDIELRREGLSYTIDTVLELNLRGAKNVHWLIGADMLMVLPKWHRAEELISLAQFVVMARPGAEIQWDSLPRRFQSLRENLVEAPLVDISSTQIRERVKQGLPIYDLTPPAVAEYIRTHRLYRE